MTETTGITKQNSIALLTKSPHGNLGDYIPPVQQLYAEDPEWLSHLVSWNHKRGSIRDAKVALPFIQLMQGDPRKKHSAEYDLTENAYAHLGLLTPRQLVQGFTTLVRKHMKTSKYVPIFRQFTIEYLHVRESNWKYFERQALQFRDDLTNLYKFFRVKPRPQVAKILFEHDYPTNSVFEAVRHLSDMGAQEAAGVILTHRIPFLIARGALGKRAGEPDIVLALIEQMSPTELVTNARLLEKMGVKATPALRGALDEKLRQAKTSTANVLKTTRAAQTLQADNVDDDSGIVAELEALQEKQLDHMKGVDGNWLILCDISGSMQHAIEVGRHIADILCRMVKGRVLLVFFNQSPRAFDVTGKTLAQIGEITKHVRADGNTNIGCGLSYALENKLEFDGITVISDGGENQRPAFAEVYPRYSQFVGKEVPVYFYLIQGQDRDVFSQNCRVMNVPLEMFDLRGGVDMYSLPTLVETMRSNRWSIVQEVYDTPLLTRKQTMVVPRQYREKVSV